jgi:hypothetical protein
LRPKWPWTRALGSFLNQLYEVVPKPRQYLLTKNWSLVAPESNPV